MGKIVHYLLLLIGALSFLYPFIWMVSATLKPENEIANLSLIPSHITFDSYRAVFDKIPIVRSFLNSLFVSSAITASVLVFSSMVGYAMTFLSFRGKNLIFYIMLFTMMIPFQITLIPTYILIVKLGLADSYLALILPFMVSAFGIFLFKQYFSSIPRDLIDAARIDGSSEVMILFRVIWPNAFPALVTVGIITFLTTWNEVLWPLIVIREQSMMTMPQMVTLFAIGGSAESQQGVILASAMLLAIPVIIIYIFFQRYFIESMASSGVKG
ncbi:MAG: carbohydrate ABC transporter permease [Candidatus Marinimicrobia bacterium]|nr:carbohydrate ABC transporter permease [Candidatus Neomarinimicrobiota bacterium]